MIPLILELKNFLSYGPTTQRIEFKEHHLICLTGKNGHGKSALLDALTWALWGQARKTTGTVKADDGLLRLGQTNMVVSLEFLFSGLTYRVRREFTKSYGKPLAALDFEVFDISKNEFFSLTDKTIRLTQVKIEQLIGLDYETFINSAFIRQGQSNEFSKKSAKERKHILANILGLSKYDVLQQQALEKVRMLTDEKKTVAALHDQNNNDLAHEATLTEQCKQEKELLQTILKEHADASKILKEHEQNLAANLNEKQTLDRIKTDLENKQRTYQQELQALQTNIVGWKRFHAQILTLPPLATLQEERHRLQLEEKRIIAIRHQSVNLQEKILQTKDAHQKRITELKNAAEQEIQKQRLELHNLELTLQQHETTKKHKQQQQQALAAEQKTLNAQKDILFQQLAQQKTFQSIFENAKQQFEKRRAYYQILVQRGNWTKNEQVELARKLSVVHDNSPACPLCEQLLTAKRKQFLGQQLVNTETFLTHRLTRIGMLLKKLKDMLVIQHEQIQQQTKQAELFTQQSTLFEQLQLKLHDVTRTHDQISQEIANLQKQITEAEITSTNKKQALTKQEQLLTETLQCDTLIKELNTHLHALEQEKATLVFDEQAYQTLQKSITLLDGTITKHQALAQELTKQQTLRNKIGQQCAILKQLKAAIMIHQGQIKQYEPVEKRVQEATICINNTTQALQQIALRKDQLLANIGSLEFELGRLDKLRTVVTQQKEALARVDQEIEDYQIIATTMSKNGIQALLIEEAIPEIEQEANAILSRLTNNQSQIFIESLRDLKSGGAKETLDIQITDTAGIRPYEMYSGGEAFRVDFALRIAIAKLLARRAGTALQTLIIDEGFGSQDEDGLSNIMDALHAISSDFSKIIIVSHLAEFKHNFPVHFIIEKLVSGSVVHVEERG